MLISAPDNVVQALAKARAWQTVADIEEGVVNGTRTGSIERK